MTSEQERRLMKAIVGDDEPTDDYDAMDRDELLFRLRDWRELANIRSERIGELEDELVVFRDQAIPEAAAIMNAFSTETRDLRRLVHDLWVAWNDDTMNQPNPPTLPLSPERAELLERTIRWVHEADR